LLYLLICGRNHLLTIFQLIQQLLVILLSLQEHVLQFAIGGFKLSCLLLKLFEGGEAIVQHFVQSFTLTLIFGSFLLELFEIHREASVFLLLKFIALFNFAVGIDEAGDFCFSILAHPLQRPVFPHGILNLNAHFVNLDLEAVDF
jgi:hypothetical protein